MLSHVALLTASCIFACTGTASVCTQVPQEVESEDVSATGVSCVASGEELYQAFLRRGLAPSGRHSFDVYNPDQQYYMWYTTFTVVYNTTILTENANGSVSMAYTLPDPSSDMCCNPSQVGCFVLQAQRQFVYRLLPSPLMYMLALPWFTLFSMARGNHVIPGFITASEFIGCWTTPPLCACHQKEYAVLRDFTMILFHKNYNTETGLESFPRINVQGWLQLVDVASENTLSSCVIYLLSVLMSLLSLPPALMALKRCKPQRDRISLALWLATQINSWLLFSVYIASYLVSFSNYHTYLSGAPQEVKHLLIPYATIGNYFVITLGSMFLLEFPFVMWYFVLNVQQRTTTIEQTCLFRFRKMAHSFGLTGIVFFLQIVGGFSVFFIFVFLASPFSAVCSLTGQANLTVVIILFTALLIYPCVARNTGRKCFKGWGVLLYTFLGAAGALGFSGVLMTLAADNFTAPLNASQIATSIVSSGLLALIVYITKVTMRCQLWLPNIVERENEETPLLDSLDNVA